MKLFLLPVLCWTLAISPIFAQKQLPLSVQPYMLHQDKTTVQLLESAGFEFDEQQLKNFETRSFDLQLDSIVVYGSYQAGDSLPVSRSIYSYPQDDVEIVHDYTFEIEHWDLYSRTTSIEDNLGRKTEVVAQLYNDELQTYVPESRINIYPHGTSDVLIDSFFVSVWSIVNEEWVRQLSSYNTFDANDRLLESVSSIEFFDIPIVFLDRYHYNNEGLLILVDSYNIDAGEEFPAGRQEMVYENGLLKSITTFTSDGLDGFMPDNKIEYQYTVNDQWEVVESYNFDFEKNDWRLWNVDEYLYDDDLRVETIEVASQDDLGLWTKSKTSYAYEHEEFLSVESTFSFDNSAGDWVVNESKYYYHKDETTGTDDPIIADAVFLYPNPTDGFVQLKLSGKISVHVYTLDGKLMKNFYLPPGEKTLNLSSFPAGIYQVMAKSDEDYFSGKLIIQ